MLLRTAMLFCCGCITSLAAKEKPSQDITSYCLSIYTLQEDYFSETGEYAPSMQKLGGGAQALPKRVHGYVPHFVGESSGYRLSPTNAEHDTLVFGSSGSLMRKNTVPHPAQMQASNKKPAARLPQQQPAVATITYKTDTVGPIPIGNKSFRLVRTRATLSAKVNWPEGIAEYQFLDEKDSVQWKEKCKVSVSDEGIESPYVSMGAVAIIAPEGKGFLLYFNMDSTSLTNMVTCRFFTMTSGILHALEKPIFFRGSIAGFRESSDTLKLDAQGNVTFAIWNGRFPTLYPRQNARVGKHHANPALRFSGGRIATGKGPLMTLNFRLSAALLLLLMSLSRTAERADLAPSVDEMPFHLVNLGGDLLEMGGVGTQFANFSPQYPAKWVPPKGTCTSTFARAKIRTSSILNRRELFLWPS